MQFLMTYLGVFSEYPRWLGIFAAIDIICVAIKSIVTATSTHIYTDSHRRMGESQSPSCLANITAISIMMAIQKKIIAMGVEL